MSTVANFSVEYIQYLDCNSHITQPLPTFATNAKLRELYRLMTLIRTCDAKAIALQRTGKMGTYPSVLGQEAISVAIGQALAKDDVFVPFYRDSGTLLQRGVTMAELFSYWGGDERGSCYAHNPQDLPMSVPIASQCLLAAGIANAVKYRKEKRVVVVTCGDGATSQGDFYEAMNIAGVWELPLVFVINNNQWAISVPRSAQTKSETLAQKAIAAGIRGVQVDGNDVIATYQATSDAIATARRDHRPTVIEAITYRLGDHTTADDAKRYRPSPELDAAWQQEPVLRLRRYLATNDGWDEQQEQALIADCEAKIAEGVAEYLARQPQPLSSIFEYHFATMPTNLQQQLQQLEAQHA